MFQSVLEFSSLRNLKQGGDLISAKQFLKSHLLLFVTFKAFLPCHWSPSGCLLIHKQMGVQAVGANLLMELGIIEGSRGKYKNICPSTLLKYNLEELYFSIFIEC